jgi:Bacterial membrane protein YfhO
VLVPFAEMLRHSQDASRSGGPGPWAMVQSFVLPEQWGRPDKFELPGGPYNYPERTAYFGTIPLLMAALGLVLGRRREQVFLLVLGLLALGLVVPIPVYSDLAAHTPGLSVVNRMRALIVCCFCGAMLAGFGLQNALDAARAGQRRLLLGAAAAVTLPLAAWVALRTSWSAPLGTALSQLPVLGHAPHSADVVELAVALRWTGLAALAVALVALVALRPRLATAVAIAAIGITAADLVTLDRGYVPAIAAPEANPPPPAAVRYARAHVGHERVGGGSGLQPNVAERFGLRGARIHALPALERRTRLWFGLGGEGLLHRLTSAPRLLASLYSVKYVFSDRRRLGDPATRLVAPGLFENRRALPRARLSYDWQPARDAEDALRRVARVRDPAVPVIEGVAPPAAGGRDRGGRARFLQDRDRTVVVDVQARQPAFLVLADTYYPGWHARVDNREAAVHPADVAFRAVRVPAGHHVVRFDYRPTSVRIGAAISLAALLVIAAGFVITRRGGGLRR